MDFIADILNQNTTQMYPHLVQTPIYDFSGFVAYVGPELCEILIYKYFLVWVVRISD